MVAAAAVVYMTHTRVRISADDSHQAITLASRSPLLVVLQFVLPISLRLNAN